MLRKAAGLATIYPYVNCKALYDNYAHDLDLIKDDAGSTYYSYHERHEEHHYFTKGPLSGILPCFCKHNMDVIDGGNKNFTFELMYSGKNHTLPICKEWVKTNY